MARRLDPSAWDESDVRVRPSKRGTRPRTKERPKHEDAQVGMMVANDATPDQLKNADAEYALRAAAQDALSAELGLEHTAPDSERDYLQHLPEGHEIFNTMDREGKPLKNRRHES